MILTDVSDDEEIEVLAQAAILDNAQGQDAPPNNQNNPPTTRQNDDEDSDNEHEDQDEDAAADEELEEDVPVELVYDDEDDGAEQEQAQARQLAFGALVERDEDRHRHKMEQYKLTKDHLIESNWTVVVKPPKKKGIDIGDRVHKNGNNAQWGTVVDGKKNPVAKGNLWTVLFDGESEPTTDLTGQQLRRKEDKRRFEWKIVEDSSPDHQVSDYEKNAIVGYNFGKRMSKSEISHENEKYSFPFLDLLMHFWPGKSALLFVSTSQKFNSLTFLQSASVQGTGKIS